MWSILETTSTNFNAELTDKRIDHQSGWSNVKLIQSKLIDLRPNVQSWNGFSPFLPASSSFDKTRSYFEIDLFNDAAFHELQTARQMDSKYNADLRCVGLEVTRDGILIATNDNFILFGRKTMRCETFEKLQIDNDDHNDRIDALFALTLYENDVVLAALRNGTIKSFCFDRYGHKLDQLSDFGGEPSTSSSNSFPLIPPASAGQVSASSSISVASTDAFLIGRDMGKSCTIQSIVQNERKSYEEVHTRNILDMNEYKALLDEDSTARNSLKFTPFINDQIVVSIPFDNFARRQRQMVQLLRTNRLVILHNGRLRLFDLRTNEMCQENSNANAELVEAASTTGENDTEYLVSSKSPLAADFHWCIKHIF